MLFSSVVFIFVFLPVTLILYYIAPEKLKNVILLVMSLVFYAWGEPVYVILMILSIVFNYLCGLDIHQAGRDKKKRKRAFLFAAAVNLLLLGFFKYFGFFMESLNTLLPFRISYHELPLPIGISFYTFQILSYIIDVYREKVPVQKNLVRFGVYVTMFPQLIAGPIVRYIDINEQLEKHEVTKEKFGMGAAFFIRGLAKKVLVANTVGMIFTEVSSYAAADLSVLSAWLGCAAYAFQIYFDFSGYSDMAVGLGKMLGFDFLKNFDDPYTSKSITEFWRRWHISLGTWFREYVYIPLGGNRVPVLKHIRNILAVWFLTGMWHGASWNFIVWGLYYGILLLGERYVWGKHLEKLPKVVRHSYSIVLILIGWVFFSHTNIREAFSYLGAMFGVGEQAWIDARAMSLVIHNWLFWLVSVLGSAPAAAGFLKKRFAAVWGRRLEPAYVVYFVLFILSVAYLITETYNPFLYFRF